MAGAMGHNQPPGAAGVVRGTKRGVAAPALRLAPPQHLEKLQDLHAQVSRLWMGVGGETVTAAEARTRDTHERRLCAVAGVSHAMEMPGDVTGVPSGQQASACSGARTGKSMSSMSVTTASTTQHTTATRVPQAKRRRTGRQLPGPEIAGHAHTTHLHVLTSSLEAQSHCLQAARQRAILNERLLISTAPS